MIADLPSLGSTLSPHIKKTIVFTFAFCTAIFCFSQGDFRKGYIVKNTGDTISGFIQDREGYRVYRNCPFSENGKQTMVVFEPKDINGYGFANGKVFETTKINTADEAGKLVFLEVKIRGQVSLYKYEGSFFVQKNTDSLQRLSNDKSKKLMGEKQVMRYSNRHIALLNTLLFDCPELRERTQNVPLVERQITELIEDYNTCMGSKAVIYNAAKSWAKFSVGITGGLHMATLEVKSYNFAVSHLCGSYEITKTPFLGVSLDILSPRLSERLSFHGDILYLNPTYRLFNVVRYPSARHENQISFNVQQIKIPIGFRYSFSPQNKITCYVNVGGSSTLNIHSRSTWDKKVVSASSTESNRYEDPMGIRFHQFGFWAGFGVMKPIHTKLKGFVELRYERAGDFGDHAADANHIKSKVTSFQFVLGIRGR